MMKDKAKEFKPSSWAIDNKTAVYVLTFMLFLMGYFAYMSLPKENFPDIVIPKIYIQTIYPGTSPSSMESLVTKQLEKQVKATQGLKKMTSNSFQDFSFIEAEFNANVDIKDAKQRIKDAVDKAKDDLPSDLPNEPTVIDINLSDMPIMYVNISGDFDLKKLKEFADDLKDRIEGLKEISKVDLVGALEPEIQINVDLNRMQAVQLSFGDIERAVGYENLTISGGTVPMDGIRRTINIKKDFKSAEEIASLAIRTPMGGIVYLRDFAEVVDDFKEQESYARLYGKNVITLNVVKRSGENLIEASDKIQTLIQEMQKKQFPKNLEIKITGDQSVKTRVTIEDLINTIIIGFILVTFILMFFMGVVNALFVALSVPLSMFLAFLTMPVLGGLLGFSYTMNMVVLFSFLLGLGIVVDDAIVVIENTHRIFDNGKMPIKQAAKIATGEVFLPVFSGTLTTLAPFVPLLFWPGIIGKFMFYLPITLIITLTASLLVAYIINPVFAVDFMKPHNEEYGKKPTFDAGVKKHLIVFGIIALIAYIINFGFGNLIVILTLFYLFEHFYLSGVIKKFQEKTWPKFQEAYVRLLVWALHRPKRILLYTVVLFILSIVLVGIRKPNVVFFPKADPNFAYVYIKLPVGTDQVYTNQVVKKVEEVVTKALGGRDNPLVSSIISNVTVGVTDPNGGELGNYPNRGKVTVAFVKFADRHGENTRVYLDKIRESVKGLIPGAEISVDQESSGPPTGKPISIEIVGDDLDSIVVTSERLKKYIESKKIAGIEGLRSDFMNNKPEILIDIDRERANREGISTGQIGMDFRTAIYGKEVSKFKDANEDYPINIRAKKEQRDDIDLLRNMKITYRDMAMAGALRQVPISSFASIDYVNTYGGIKRKQQKRIIILSSNVLGGYNPNAVVANIEREIKMFKTPDDVMITMGGEKEDQKETSDFLGRAGLIALGLILLILVIQFNSIGKPIIIISEIMFSIIGVLLGVAIFGMNISIVMTGVGIIALAGIVVRNGILLVEFADLMLEQGMSPYDAVVEAGRARMTPVLLTATATIFGLIPLAIGLNINFEHLLTSFNPHIFFGGDSVAFWGPLSWTMIFGLTFATFLTLILVPSMYLMLNDTKEKIKKIRTKTK